MQLRHFFENMVRREEMASAFLATLLDYDAQDTSTLVTEASSRSILLPLESTPLTRLGPTRISLL